MGSHKIDAQRDDICILFGKRLRDLRYCFGDTPKSLAEEMGVHKATILRLERGEKNNIAMYIPFYLEYYGITLEQLVKGEF